MIYHTRYEYYQFIVNDHNRKVFNSQKWNLKFKKRKIVLFGTFLYMYIVIVHAKLNLFCLYSG